MSGHHNSLDALGRLWIGAIGLASLGLQPQILLAMIATGWTGIDAGRLATVEIGAMAIASAAIMGGAMGPFRVSLSSLGCALMFAGNLLAAFSDAMVVAVAGRTLAGFGEGILASAGVVAVLNSARPVRVSACFVTIAAIPPLAGSVILSFVGGNIGPTAPFLLLAAGSLLALVPVVARRSLPSLALPQACAPTARSCVILALLWLLNAVASACWAYLGALGRENGLGPGFVGHSLSVGLLMQMAASILLAWRGPDRRLGLFLLVAVYAEGGAVLAASEAGGRPLTYLIAAALFGFSLHAVSPLATGLFAQSDPTRRSSYLVLPGTLFGIASGPAIASLFPSPSSAFLASAVLLCGVGAIMAFYMIAREWLPRSRANMAIIVAS